MGDSSSRQYSCAFCGRTFVRNEHLIRHRRIRKSPPPTHRGPPLTLLLPDTHEKPFACGYCPLRFSRSDQYRRHVLSSHADLPLHDVRLGGTAPADKQERVKIACDNCNKAKVKCVKGIRCGSCVSKGLECKISDNRLAALRVRSSSTSAGSLGDLAAFQASRPFQQSNTDPLFRADETIINTDADASSGQSRTQDDDALESPTEPTAPAPMVNDFDTPAIFDAVEGAEVQEGIRMVWPTPEI